MLTKPTEQEEKAIARIAMSEDGQKLLNYLSGELKRRDIETRSASEEFLYRSQGRALQLNEIIEMINTAKPATY